MIRSMSLVACAVGVACISASSRTTVASSAAPAPVEDASIVASRAFRLLFERGIAHRDTIAINAAVAPEVTFHKRQTVARIPRAALLGMANEILTGFPDVHFTVPSVVAHGVIPLPPVSNSRGRTAAPGKECLRRGGACT